MFQALWKSNAGQTEQHNRRVFNCRLLRAGWTCSKDRKALNIINTANFCSTVIFVWLQIFSLHDCQYFVVLKTSASLSGVRCAPQKSSQACLKISWWSCSAVRSSRSKTSIRCSRLLWTGCITTCRTGRRMWWRSWSRYASRCCLHRDSTSTSRVREMLFHFSAPHWSGFLFYPLIRGRHFHVVWQGYNLQKCYRDILRGFKGKKDNQDRIWIKCE